MRKNKTKARAKRITQEYGISHESLNNFISQMGREPITDDEITERLLYLEGWRNIDKNNATLPLRAKSYGDPEHDTMRFFCEYETK